MTVVIVVRAVVATVGIAVDFWLLFLHLRYKWFVVLDMFQNVHWVELGFLQFLRYP